MTDPTTPPAKTEPHGRSPEDRAERPDLGRQPDAMIEALNGSDSGSDTRAGSLQGGVATGSEDDPDSRAINADLAAQGRAAAAARTPASVGSSTVKNTGAGPGETTSGEGPQGDEADAATG